MAYIDLAERFTTAPLPFLFAPAEPIRETVREFTPREWTVIRLARQDRLSSLREEGEFKNFLRLVFGFARKTGLSDPKLEALRRIAVLSWHYSYNVNASEIGDFLAAGYSIEHYDAMLVHMGLERAASATRRTRS